MKSGHPESRRRLETQVLHFDGQDWRGYTYAWNDAQTDADLVAAEGMDRTLVVADPEAPGGRREQTWHFPSRAECLTCHNSWSGYRLSFNPLQLGKDHAGADQLESFQALGLLSAPKGGIEGPTADGGKPAQKLTNPYDPSANLDERARSYLQVNCAHCHQFGGGGTANISLRYDTPLEQTLILDVRPSQGTFGIYDARIVAHGDPYRSVLFYRMAKLGPGRMPRIGSDLLDEDGLRLMRDWIAQGPPGKVEDAPDAGRKPATPAATPGLEGLAAGPPEARAATIAQLLGSTGGALRLARALGEASWPEGVRAEVLAAATAHPDGQVRDLFEPYVPASDRVKRLGNAIRPGELLALKGDAARGQELFFNASGVSCKDCHQVAGRGGAIGPDLSQIGKKYDRAGLLESLLEPSKAIEPKYRRLPGRDGRGAGAHRPPGREDGRGDHPPDRAEQGYPHPRRRRGTARAPAAIPHAGAPPARPDRAAGRRPPGVPRVTSLSRPVPAPRGTVRYRARSSPGAVRPPSPPRGTPAGRCRRGPCARRPPSSRAGGVLRSTWDSRRRLRGRRAWR